MHDEELLTGYLNGELSPREREAFEARMAATPALRATVRVLSSAAAVEPPGAAFNRRVLAAVAVRPQRKPRRASIGGWALALAASFAAFVVGVGAGRGVDSIEGLLHPGKVRIQFVLREPAASAVSVVGDFNAWDASGGAMHPSGGSWSRTLWLSPGVHEYQFVIDGARRAADPAAPVTADDGFGAQNSVIHVTPVQAL